jgi:hypothetical protein
MNWLRNNDPNPADGRSDRGAGEPCWLPCPAVCLRRRAPVVDSVNWLRNNDVKPEDVNEPLLRL